MNLVKSCFQGDGVRTFSPQWEKLGDWQEPDRNMPLRTEVEVFMPPIYAVSVADQMEVSPDGSCRFQVVPNTHQKDGEFPLYRPFLDALLRLQESSARLNRGRFLFVLTLTIRMQRFSRINRRNPIDEPITLVRR
jgi:hypothetical protein